MDITDEQKKEILTIIENSEGMEVDEVINLQIERVARDVAKLIWLLEGGNRLFGIDSEIFRKLKTSGSAFLNHLVDAAIKLKIQLQ